MHLHILSQGDDAETGEGPRPGQEGSYAGDSPPLYPQVEQQNCGIGGESMDHRPAIPLFSESLPPPYRLQQVQVKIVDNTLCEKLYRNATRLSNHGQRLILQDMLCAGSHGRDSCYVSPAHLLLSVPIPTSGLVPIRASFSSRVTQVGLWSAM